MNVQPFAITLATTVLAGTSSSSISLDPETATIRIANSGSNAVFFRLTVGASTATLSDTPLLPGFTEEFSKGRCDTLSVRTASGSSQLYCSAAPVTPAGTDPSAAALFSAMVVQPDDARKALINAWYVGMRADGLLTKMALFHIPAIITAAQLAVSNQPAQLNLINPAIGQLIEVNSPLLTADRGYTGDGVSAYLETGIAQNALAPFAQNAAHIGAWNLTAGAVGNSRVIGKSASGTSSCIISPNNTGGIVSFQVNGGTVASFAPMSFAAYNVGVRVSSTSDNLYQNGVSGVLGATATSGALDATTIRYLSNGAGAFSQCQLALANYGDVLTDTDVANLFTRCQNLLHGIGAV